MQIVRRMPNLKRQYLHHALVYDCCQLWFQKASTRIKACGLLINGSGEADMSTVYSPNKTGAVPCMQQ